MQKSSTMRRTANKIFQGRQLTIGMDLGDRWSFYCVLEESGKVILEEKLATMPEAMKQTFARISPGCWGQRSTC
jgi:transposase